MNEYTPPTQVIKYWYVTGRTDQTIISQKEASAEFDRWLEKEVNNND